MRIQPLVHARTGRRPGIPALVVGNRNDPATRYQDAVSTSRLLARGRLLTVAGWGHTSLFLSSCADAYLVPPTLPRRSSGRRPGDVDSVSVAVGFSPHGRRRLAAAAEQGGLAA